MHKKRILLLTSLITITLIIVQFGLTSSVVFLTDKNNDVQFIENSVLKKTGDYQNEVDILSISFVGANLTLNLEGNPIIDDGNHYYKIGIYWDINSDYVNSTIISVGALPGESYSDTITKSIVNSSGISYETYPTTIVNSTVVGSNKLSWNLNINNLTHPETPSVVNATAIYREVTAEGTVEYKDIASTAIAPALFSTQNLLPLLGTILVCGFAGYTLGSILVYFLTTNIRSKEKNAIFMGAATFALAIIVNWLFWVSPWQILWNSILYVLVVFFGYFWANRGIMRLKFESPLPDGLPIETDEDMKSVVILSKGEGEYYNPLPLIRKFNLNKETGVAQKHYLLQPFEFSKIKRKYNQILKSQKELSSEDILSNEGKNPYKKILRSIKKKMEESILAIDHYQEAYVDDWPTINQALLRAISLGSKEITILNLFASESFEYHLAVREMKRIDFSKIGITIKQTEFLGKSKEIQDYLIKKITDAIPKDSIKEKIGVLLIADGQAKEWDELYQSVKEEDEFRENIKKKLVKSGFNEKLIEFGWINKRSPSIADAFNSLLEGNCNRIIYVTATTPIDCVDTLVDIPNTLNSLAKKHDIELMPISAWNDDDEIIKIYLRLITNAKELPLDSLGKEAEIILQSTKVGAKLASTQEEEKESNKDSSNDN
ncbi:MAG TPA: hypothetical protein VMX55_13940 [candidate division Zixibacteria bacterium]|nr:hypothetical protein [candidate division Zixibacteria bacterium]